MHILLTRILKCVRNQLKLGVSCPLMIDRLCLALMPYWQVYAVQLQQGGRIAYWLNIVSAADQWLQFDVGPPTLITGVVTRGRGDGSRRQWVSRFLVSYSNDTAVWYYYKDASQLEVQVT